MLTSTFHTHLPTTRGRGQTQQARAYLDSYFAKYQNRFSPANLAGVQVLRRSVQVLAAYFEAQCRDGNVLARNSSVIMTLDEFRRETKLDVFNFYEIDAFCEKSNIARKVSPLL